MSPRYFSPFAILTGQSRGFSHFKKNKHPNLTGNYDRQPSTWVERYLLVSKFPSELHRSTINPVWNIPHRYRTRSGFTHLKPNPTFTSDRKLGAKSKYLRRKRTIGVDVFFVLPSFRPRNFATLLRFYRLETNPAFNADRKWGAKTKYLRRKWITGV